MKTTRQKLRRKLNFNQLYNMISFSFFYVYILVVLPSRVFPASRGFLSLAQFIFCVLGQEEDKKKILLAAGRDPFNQNSYRSAWEKWSTSKGGPVFSKLFRLDRTDPLSFGPKFPEILVEWIAPSVKRK